MTKTKEGGFPRLIGPLCNVPQPWQQRPHVQSHVHFLPLFQGVVLFTLRKDDVKLVRRNFIIIQSFGEQSVDCISFGNGERGDLLMFFNFGIKFFAGDYQP